MTGQIIFRRLVSRKGDELSHMSLLNINGGIRLKVGFQPLIVISPAASWIRWCMQVYVGVFVVICGKFGPVLFWASTFLWGAKSLNSATGEQKGITQTNYTDSEQTSRLSNSLMPSAKLNRSNLPLFMSFGVAQSRIEPGPPAPRPDTLTTMLQGRSKQ